MIDFLVNNLNNLLITGDCYGVLGKELTELLEELFNWIQIIVPCLVLVLCSVDCASAVIAQDEKAIKETLNKIVKRVIIGVAIFFVPILLDILLDFADIVTGVCGIGG